MNLKTGRPRSAEKSLRNRSLFEKDYFDYDYFEKWVNSGYE